MGKHTTYEYLHDNPSIDFRAIDYTNNPLLIARQDNMVAINSALGRRPDRPGDGRIDRAYVLQRDRGLADFMRGGDPLHREGRTILDAAGHRRETGWSLGSFRCCPDGSGACSAGATSTTW